MGQKRRIAHFGALAAFAVAAALGAPGARALEVAGVELAEAIDVGGARLQLNGAGARTLFIVRTYVAALYVPTPATQPQALIGQPGPRRLSLTMLAALSADWIVERFVSAMRANHRDDELVRLHPRLDRLVDTLLALERMRKGARIDIDALGGATRVSVDGRALGPDVPGEDVFDALLRAFLGEQPLDAALKRAMLGKPRPDDGPGM